MFFSDYRRYYDEEADQNEIKDAVFIGKLWKQAKQFYDADITESVDPSILIECCTCAEVSSIME